MTSVNNNKPEILTKLGIGSGINTTELIDTLVKAETEGIRESLDNKETEYNSQISAFSQIRNNLKVFNENLELIQRKNAMGYQGSSSDKTIATFTANGNSGAQSVNSSLTVSSLATAHTLTGPSLASPNATVGARTISIAFGTWSADPTQGGGQTHTANSLSSVSVTASSTTTLNQLRDMINSAVTDSDNDGQQDVTATVLYDGSNYMLSLKSQFGASNEMKITDNHASAPVYAYDTTDGAQLTQRVAGTNSSFTLDGISMSRSTNTIDDLYNGLTLQLFATTSSAITIKSEVDLESARTSIEDFVTTYNDVMVSLMELRQSIPNEDSDSVNLAGDSLLRSIISEMRRSNSMEINGYEDGPYYLSNLGVKTMRDGTLSFADPSMLERTFKQNAESLRSFFKDQIISDNAAIAPKSYSIANTKPGSYAVSVSSGNVTVGGVSASGSGSTYTVPSGDPSGMVLEISSSNTSGTIHYGRSFISLLQQKLETYIKFDGLIESKIDGNRMRLSQLAQKQANLEDRIASLYLRYQTQYSAMESTIAGLNETSSLLENAFKRNSD